MGGELELRAVFPDGEATHISIAELLDHTAGEDDTIRAPSGRTTPDMDSGLAGPGVSGVLMDLMTALVASVDAARSASGNARLQAGRASHTLTPRHVGPSL
jgi:hypothetical protein